MKRTYNQASQGLGVASGKWRIVNQWMPTPGGPMQKREIEEREVKMAREECVEVKEEKVKWVEDEVEELERWDGLE